MHEAHIPHNTPRTESPRNATPPPRASMQPPRVNLQQQMGICTDNNQLHNVNTALAAKP